MSRGNLPTFHFPRGLNRKQVTRLLEIDDALHAGDLDVLSYEDARVYELNPPRCEACQCVLEAGHCYCCQPVGGYGARFAEQRHGGQQAG